MNAFINFTDVFIDQLLKFLPVFIIHFTGS